MLPVLELRNVTKRFEASRFCPTSACRFLEVACTRSPAKTARQEHPVKIIGGVHQPSSGRILKDGDPIVPVRRSKVAVTALRSCTSTQRSSLI
jgi:hypothetical protein